MKYEICPVVNVYDLEKALNLQYGEGFCDELSSMLFGDDYYNDSYKAYSFDELETYEGENWQDEDHIRFENCVKTYLQDIFPNYSKVLIDVSW